MANQLFPFLRVLINFVIKYTFIIVVFVLIISMSLAYYYLSNASKEASHHSSQLSAKRYLEALTAFRSLYTSEVIKTAKNQGLTVTHNYQEFDNAIPLPATLSMALGKEIGKKQSGAKTYLYSPYPFPWRKKENKQIFTDVFPKDAWQYLTKNPDKSFSRIELSNGRMSIRYAVADIMRESCIDCHNNHAQTPKNDWQVGDVRGVMEVILPIGTAQDQSQSSLKATFLILAAMTLVITLILFLFIVRSRKDAKELSCSNQEMKVAHQALRIKTNELLESNRVKSDFLATMSHEIRTPINGVIGMLTLLKQSPLTNEQQRHAFLASSSADSLLSLINDILDFSKMEAGKLTIESLDFNLCDLIGNFASTLAPKAHEKGIELIIDVSQVQLTSVKGDPSRLRQILTNLVSNAIKFTDQGEIVIKASLEKINEQEMYFLCKVTDTGIGIAEDKVNNMFERFTQADTSTTRQYGGSGLGLAIVQNLCQLMGGEVSATSILGQGTTVSFNIKLLTSHQTETLMPSVDISNTNILIVDDNKTNLEVLSGQLNNWGANIVQAFDGQNALSILSKNLNSDGSSFFDVAILDMQMPNMDGAELARLIKLNAQYSKIKLVMMTSIGKQGDAEFFASLGFDCYFSKPASVSELFDALTIVIDDGNALQDASPLLTSHNIRTLKRSNLPKNTHILLVEDNSINQIVAQGMLKSFGATSDIAKNGKEALVCLDKQHYDLVLMDCQMPIMDGYTATKLIRSSTGKFQNIYIIAMTANAMVGDKEKCLSAGMNEYISKPIDIDELEKKIVVAVQIQSQLNKAEIANTTSVKRLTIETDEAEEHLLVWDKIAFLKRVSNNSQLAQKVIHLFCSEMPNEIAALQEAINHDDIKEVENLAHKIKGTTSNISGNKLAGLVLKIEMSAKEKNIERVTYLATQLQSELQELISQLDKQL
ncbi:MAG: response regulator [Colwellia sp.]|nr:response regulator [Colwellia sp.]